MTDIDKFVDAYIECALWSSIDMDTENPLDDLYGMDDISKETFMGMRTECADFIDYCERENIELPEDDEMNGHDFWLTRNEHGTGFWDRGYENGDELTKAAKTFGSCDLYPGDDGNLYIA